MFGSSKKIEEKKSPLSSGPSSGPSSLNALVKGTLVEGTVKSESDLRVDGTVKGKLSCSAKVIIGPTGNIDGEIRCQNAVIEGKFTGNIWVTELLNIRETAEINGEVYTSKLTVQPGAVFNVNVHMTDGANGSSGQSQMKNGSTVAVAAGAEKTKN